ncbi:MAG TPA: hypothetical protein VEL73_10450, partial [Mycobacteriales bacterium]|nr:hypothetical protein [Mycobacteriales bacterium]
MSDGGEAAVGENGTAAPRSSTSPPVAGAGGTDPDRPSSSTGRPLDDPRREAVYDGGDTAYDPGSAHRYADGRAPLRRRPVEVATFPDGAHAPVGGWRRVLLKLSGEALSGGTGLGIDPDVVARIAAEIAAVV